jgi:signal transduction histidine kinase
MLKAIRDDNDFNNDLSQLNRLVKGASLLNSDAELDAFFGELKSAVILVDNSCKITYLNKTAIGLSNNDKEIAKKGALVIDLIKQMLGPVSLIKFYEHLINKKEIVIQDGFNLSRIEKLILNPISNDGFVIKILVNELFTVSTSNFFRYFPSVPIAYFGFHMGSSKRISVRFVSDNFNHIFPQIDLQKILETEDYFLTYIHTEDLPMFLLKIQQLRKTRSLCEVEFRFVEPDGNLKWYKLTAGKVNEQSDKNFWLAYIEEIHEKKMAISQREELVHETLDEERKRIAMELHDDLGQNLVSLNLMLSMIDHDGTGKTEIIGRCKELATDNITKMKSLIYNLAPPELDKGISNALESLFGRLTEISSEIEFHYSNKLSDSKKIPSDISFNIFRIVQEFVSNSQKYSNCKNVFCLIKSKGLKIQIQLSDDGSGFDIDKVKRGFGLGNIEKRANLIGASFNLQSEVGAGTILTLEF